MIRTNVVKLETMQAFAYRQKLKAGDVCIVILKPDVQQPGMTGVSRKTGEPVLTKNTNPEKFPPKAFKEAYRKTVGMPYRKQSSIVRKMIAEGEKAADIRDYIVANKLRNIAEEDLSDGEIKLIVELLDEASPKGVFKELNSEIRRDLAKVKVK